ncbi:MAG: zinc-dependent alcohol dehydrogenase family protein [Candidatus Nanopelagicales bacterium]
MRRLLLRDPGPVDSDRLTADRRDDPPAPAAGEVLVRVHACAVCRTDLQIVTGDLPAHRLPVVPGHQVVGRVAAVGDGVDPARVGSRVGLAWIAGACGECRFCRSGRENLCPDATFTGWDVDGGYADTALARSDFAFDLPDLGPAYDDAPGGADAAIAPLLCGGVIGYRSLRVAGMDAGQRGARLGLYGFGASATIVVQVARHWGLEPYVVTRSAGEAERALALGAVWAGTYDEPPPVRLDAAITFAPAGFVVAAAVKALDLGGTVAINAIHLDEVPAMDYDDLWLERSIRSVANVTRDDVREFLALVPAAGVRTEYEVLPLDDANEALRRLDAGLVRGAFVLVT